ncbi:alpha/beta fold hydrolase [bacterium]|nr:alpha/beta fold hydrolase [bacterium]
MKLHYVEYGKGHRKTVIILHGLLGSERNWHTIARRMSDRFHLLIPDLRNHGISPHDPVHSIVSMREDLEVFIAEHIHNPFYLIGHSMGGHVAMNYAFYHPAMLHSLIVEDIAPRSYGTGLIEIIQAMQDIHLSQFKEKKQVELALEYKIKNRGVRQFVVTNLVRHHDVLSWRVNLPALKHFAEHEIVRFKAHDYHEFKGPTLFIGGENSQYHLKKDESLIKKHFPKARIEMVEHAGHWIHHENPERFYKLVTDFINE